MIVRFSRERVELAGDGVQHGSGSLLVLIPVRGKAAIADVVGTEVEFRATVERLKRAGSVTPTFRIILPGQDPWWDAECAWPPRSPRSSRDVPEDSEAFLLDPLDRATWFPPAIFSLFRYVFVTAPQGKRWSRWPVTRPKLVLELAPDFSAVERAEILDVVEAAWGRSRVQGPADIPRLSRPPWAILWWLGVIACYAVTLYGVAHHWLWWQHLVGIALTMWPVLIARHKEADIFSSAPRRAVAQEPCRRS